MSGGGSKPGERRGGREKGTPNKATAEVRELAGEYGPAALTELARLSTEANTDTARIQACNAILDRAYGRALPGRPITIELPDTSTVEGVTTAIAAIVQATASGEITPGEAGELCSILDVQRRGIEMSDIAARVASLEAGQGGRV
jgi:hypothetical protein